MPRKSRSRRAKSKREPNQVAVNEFTAQHGDYRTETLTVTDGELESGRHQNIRVLRNRGGTTVERWLSAGSLSPTQAEAISLYARAWRLWLGEQRVTANWSLVSNIRGMPASDFVDSRLSAKELLDHLDANIFRRMPAAYVNVWQNVVIFDEAAGVAGARLGYSNRQAETSAKTIVLFVADMIATDMRLGTAA